MQNADAEAQSIVRGSPAYPAVYCRDTWGVCCQNRPGAADDDGRVAHLPRGARLPAHLLRRDRAGGLRHDRERVHDLPPPTRTTPCPAMWAARCPAARSSSRTCPRCPTPTPTSPTRAARSAHAPPSCPSCSLVNTICPASILANCSLSDLQCASLTFWGRCSGMCLHA